MSKKPSHSERKALYKAHYQGRDVVEVLNYSVVHGRTYAEIRFEDGRLHSVPADEIYLEKKEEENDQYL